MTEKRASEEYKRMVDAPREMKTILGMTTLMQTLPAMEDVLIKEQQLIMGNDV